MRWNIQIFSCCIGMDAYKFKTLHNLETHFVPVSEADCPCSDNDPTGCILPECSYNMNQNGLCNAGQILPNGDDNYDVNNCPGGHDVFRYQGGKTEFFDGAIFTH